MEQAAKPAVLYSRARAANIYDHLITLKYKAKGAFHTHDFISLENGSCPVQSSLLFLQITART